MKWVALVLLLLALGWLLFGWVPSAISWEDDL